MKLRRITGISAALTLSCASALGTPAEPNRAPPLDTQCPWGRLGDGRGAFVRCLTEAEATRLMAAAEPPTAPRAAPPPPAAPAPAAPPPPVAPAPPEPTPAPVTPSVDVEIRQPLVDVGSLPEAVKSLQKAKERLVECIEKNGGLGEAKGEVEVRFLVQGRGRAEGVSIRKKRSVSDRAAQCVADVIDRRFVGYPEEPLVTATLAIAFSKKPR